MQNIKLINLTKQSCIFKRNCSQSILKKLTEIQSAESVTTKKKASHLYKLNDYFNSQPKLKKILPLIPLKHLVLKHPGSIESLYLINPEWAAKVAEAILPHLRISNMLICETLPGLGLITDRLLNNGIKLIRLYEQCPEFRKYLKEHHKDRPKRIQLFMKDIFQLGRYSTMDRIDNYKRVDQLLSGIPMKRWKDTPCMTIVGCATKNNFISFLLKELCLHSKVFDNGRIQLFIMMRPRDYLKITARPEDGCLLYGSRSILFNTFFKQKILLKIPRKSFLPWETEETSRVKHLDRENIYLVRITAKPDFHLPKSDLPAFYCFIKQFYSRRTSKIIPSLEKWVPGCGLNFLLPKMEHQNYYKDMNIYTTFGALQPDQALALFKEMRNHPDYERSSFAALVESQLIKSETNENAEIIDEVNKDMLHDFTENREI